MTRFRSLLAVVLTLSHPVLAWSSEAGSGATGALGHSLPVYSVLPFCLLLLCIAVMPLAYGHWWEHNRNKAIVVVLLSLPIMLYLLPVWTAAGYHEIVDKIKEYLSFMSLLGALYIISGGIYIRGSLSGSPLGNTAILGLGAVLASFIGTTGASVLLIRPLLRANQPRVAKAHIVVFFIFIVSNCGGLLTPLGDPPLFLGFLKGVDFFWTTKALWSEWLAVNAALLVIFQIYDQIVFDREEKARKGSQLEEVMKHYPHIKVIFISGYAEDAFIKTYGTERKFNFLPKPFTLKQLAGKVKEVVEKEDA